MPVFDTLLIANRGEIAVRIAATAKKLGLRTVAVYSEADVGAPHVRAADMAVCIGEAAVEASYLNGTALLEAARKTGAGAIHPGYGFLSESESFATACADAGIIFVGPSPQAIGLMGNKRAAREAVAQQGVPVIPGFTCTSQENEDLRDGALELGLPVMVKAAAGGGGRGMRLVTESSAIEEALNSARAEAHHAFGNGELLLEKAILHARHVEVQVFGDQQGQIIYLGDRDCSVQRRHQKVVEEAPAPGLGEDLRKALGEAAVAVAQTVNYTGAGTVEFLVDEAHNFYFLEMNTRLQVEHGVTELVTGLDLVAWQLQVAMGHSLPMTQDQVPCSGHAIEVRLYAEDGAYRPCTGTVLAWDVAGGDYLRVDTGIEAGSVVTADYDPMLAKVMAHGATREQARQRVCLALQDTVLLGLHTNQQFLVEILRHEAFASGQFTTNFLKKYPPQLPSPITHASLAVALFHARSAAKVPSLWRNFYSANPPQLPYLLQNGDTERACSLQVLGNNHYRVTLDEESYEVTLVKGDTSYTVSIDGVTHRCKLAFDGDTLWLHHRGMVSCWQDVSLLPKSAQEQTKEGDLVAVMDGKVTEICVTPGDSVSAGQTLVILQAMKMEHHHRAGKDGIVASLEVGLGDQVRARQKLVTLTESQKS